MPRLTPIASAVLALLAACGTHHDATPRVAPHMIADHYYVEPGAPDPLACTSDADCTLDKVTDATGCCIPEGMPYPQTRAWQSWLAGHRAQCNMACPGTMSPPVPSECMVDIHCTAGRCASSC